MNLSGDLALFYADFGVDAVLTPKAGGAAVFGLVLFDQPGHTVINGEVLYTDYSLRYPAATFPVVRKGDAFVLPAGNFTARENAQPLQDGLEHIVPLAVA